MAKPQNLKRFSLVAVLLIALLVGLVLIVESTFAAPKKSGPVIEYKIPKTTTLTAITGDLKYYGFIKNENALKFSLWVKGGVKGQDIKRDSTYKIAQTMSAWQIAKVLLSDGTYSPCNQGCPESNFSPELLPGGDLAPTITQKYEWVKTYEDCVKSIGHDGGQLSSEQYFQRTGIRKCVSPDGREFTQGKEGWTKAIGG